MPELPNRRKQAAENKADLAEARKEAKPLSSSLKDDLVLFGFLVLFVGLVSTDTYYAAFGIRYQFLSLPSFHVVYRGLSVLILAPYLLLPYAITIVLLWLDRDVSRVNRRIAFRRWRTLLSYGLIMLMLTITYPLARYAGNREAERDLYEDTSNLPEVVNLILEGETQETDEFFEKTDTHYRLLLTDADYVIVFKPLPPGARGLLPNIKRLKKGDVHVIETNR